MHFSPVRMKMMALIRACFYNVTTEKTKVLRITADNNLCPHYIIPSNTMINMIFLSIAIHCIFFIG
ncbi:MAG TPA: hypothetical protein DCG73_15215 [Morganella sp. (in: Bacteria)]|nr:hypothetical protein [Morganella sp. (in: enterobacteria)]